MVGRVETYIHSDNITAHKGGAMVRVNCDTDFGARTSEFINFSKLCALRAYASGADTYQGLIDMFPDVEVSRKEVSKALKEVIDVDMISIIYL